MDLAQLEAEVLANVAMHPTAPARIGSEKSRHAIPRHIVEFEPQMLICAPKLAHGVVERVLEVGVEKLFGLVTVPPALFDCATRERCATPDEALLGHALHDWKSFLSYGQLPNGKFMLNWPFHANDFPMNRGMFESREVRARASTARRR